MAKNKNSKQPLSLQEQMKRQLRKYFKGGRNGRPHAMALYVITCIWLTIAVVNFLLGHSEIAAIFAAIGLFTLAFSLYADWKESRRKEK